MTRYQNIINTVSEAQLTVPNIPPIETEWEVSPNKYLYDNFMNQHNKNAKKMLTINVNKLNKLF